MRLLVAGSEICNSPPASDLRCWVGRRLIFHLGVWSGLFVLLYFLFCFYFVFCLCIWVVYFPLHCIFASFCISFLRLHTRKRLHTYSKRLILFAFCISIENRFVSFAEPGALFCLFVIV